MCAVHGVDQNGKTVLVKPRVSRAALPEFIASLPPCVIGIEPARLMAPKFVSPYHMAGKTGKNDAADAIAICEAVQRPHRRFVPIKDDSQQLMELKGIGPTTACAPVASIGNAHDFKNGHQLASLFSNAMLARLASELLAWRIVRDSREALPLYWSSRTAKIRVSYASK